MKKVLDIGVVLEDLSARQKTIEFLTFMATNETPYDMSVTAFVQNNLPPCIKPNIPTMQIADMHSFDGVLIVTSLETLKSAVQVDATQILHYIYYPEFLGEKPRHNLRYLFTLPDIVRIARCSTYRDIVKEEFDCEVLDTTVANFDMNILGNICKEQFYGRSRTNEEK